MHMLLHQRKLKSSHIGGSKIDSRFLNMIKDTAELKHLMKKRKNLDDTDHENYF